MLIRSTTLGSRSIKKFSYLKSCLFVSIEITNTWGVWVSETWWVFNEMIQFKDITHVLHIFIRKWHISLPVIKCYHFEKEADKYLVLTILNLRAYVLFVKSYELIRKANFQRSTIKLNINKGTNQKLWFFQKESSSCFNMLALFGILHHCNDLITTEGMKARFHLQFYGRKITYEACYIFQRF